MTDIFSGSDRIEHSPRLGRPIRMGNPDALAVGDVDRINDSLARGDFEDAATRLDLFHALGHALTATFLEWVVALPSVLPMHGDGKQDAPSRIVERAQRLFGTSNARDFYGSDLTAFADSLLADLSAESIRMFREDRDRSVRRLLNDVTSKLEAVKAALTEKNGAAATAAFSRYVEALRSRHDLCGELVSTLARATMEELSQAQAIKAAQDALEGCALVSGMWDLIATLDPHTLAAFLAEHLRGHFSGVKRSGSVRIIEDDEKIRLVFEPCGSGGAYRQRAPSTLALYPGAAPTTWGRAGEVPMYCAHCACNELTSIDKLGYPAWVTEFQRDAASPCGWTIYKRPDQIPDEYFARLGRNRSTK